MSRVRAWIDAAIAPVALAVLRDAVGHDDPVEALKPARAVPLRAGTFVAFWSLAAGVGTSTLAALTAHRSAAGGHPPLLVDLDRWAPSLALRAGLECATVADALLRPGRERELVSRWNAVPFLAGTPTLRAAFDAPRVAAVLRAAAAGSAVVADLGAGEAALDPVLLGEADRVCLCVGPRVSQLQAAFCAVTLLAPFAERTVVAVVGADRADAERIAARLPWRLAAAIPADEHLARDDFAARANTLREVDALIRMLT